MSTKQVLQGAAETLEKYGHVKHKAGSRMSGFCAMGAIEEVCCADASAFTLDGERLYYQSVDAFQKYMSFQHWGQIVTWNDNPSTEASEVIQALRDAANSL